MGPQFFETWMGQMFFEGTLPRLLQQVTRLADVGRRDGSHRTRAGRAQGGDAGAGDGSRCGCSPGRANGGRRFVTALSIEQH
jgi:hypothetical protein